MGLILTAIASFFAEIASTIGKIEVGKKEEGVFAMGFLNIFWGAVIFGCLLIINPDRFIFSSASLPTFGLRVILEIAQAYATMMAIAQASRSSFNFIRVITIPLLVVADIALGYQLLLNHFLGISLVVLMLFLLFLNRGLDKAGSGYITFSAINAVFSISLYKYNITHFNSFEAEQFIMYSILIIFFFTASIFISKVNPVRLLGKKIIILQSASMGIADVLQTIAYAVAPASLVITVSRSASVFWSIISGAKFFDEKKPLIKLIALFGIAIGLFLVAN